MKSVYSAVRKAKPKARQKSPSKKIRGYDALKPFLHEVNKIVSKECARHESMEGLSWYKTWEKWNAKDLFTSTSINVIGKIVCPELKYNEQTNGTTYC